MLVSGTQPVISTRTVCALSAEPSLQLPVELFKSLCGLFSEYVNCKGLLLKKIRMREPREGGEEKTEGKEVCAHEEREEEAKRSKLRPWEDIKQTWSRSMHTPQESQKCWTLHSGQAGGNIWMAVRQGSILSGHPHNLPLGPGALEKREKSLTQKV